MAQQNWRRGHKQLDPRYIRALHERARDLFADQRSEALKGKIRVNLSKRPKDTVPERRARMLLQSASFLDIDKLIEHRPPLENLSFWKRPPIPQLSLERFQEHSVPIFAPARCDMCHDVIRGSFFCPVKDLRSSHICESCFRKSNVRQKGFVKAYKHCILRETVTGEVSRQICRCSSVPRRDSEGKFRALFPVASSESHRANCGLFNLVDSVAQAKYDGWLLPMEKRRTLGEEERLNEERVNKKRARMKKKLEKERKKGKKEIARYGKTGLSIATDSSLVNYAERTPTTQSTVTAEDEDAADDIPGYVRPFTDRYPFGNVHMALRVGPLLIENGVKQ